MIGPWVHAQNFCSDVLVARLCGESISHSWLGVVIEIIKQDGPHVQAMTSSCAHCTGKTQSQLPQRSWRRITSCPCPFYDHQDVVMLLPHTCKYQSKLSRQQRVMQQAQLFHFWAHGLVWMCAYVVRSLWECNWWGRTRASQGHGKSRQNPILRVLKACHDFFHWKRFSRFAVVRHVFRSCRS